MYDRILLATDGTVASANAAAHALDVLVLGTKRRPEAYRNLIGSVTDRVVRLADRPVLVVKTEVERRDVSGE